MAAPPASLNGSPAGAKRRRDDDAFLFAGFRMAATAACQ